MYQILNSANPSILCLFLFSQGRDTLPGPEQTCPTWFRAFLCRSGLRRVSDALIIDLLLNFNCPCLVSSWFLLDCCWSLPAPPSHTEQRRLWAEPPNFSHLPSLGVDRLTVMTAPSKVNIAMEGWARLSWIHVFIDPSWEQAESVFSHFLSRSFMHTSWVKGIIILIQDSKATAEWVLPLFAALDSWGRLGPLIFQGFNDYFQIILVNLFFSVELVFWCLDFSPLNA